MFIPLINTIILLERDHRKFKVYDAKNVKFRKEVSGHRGAILHCCYLKGLNLIATCGNDMMINFWGEVKIDKRFCIRCREIPMQLSWCTKLNRLYACTSENRVFSWYLGDIENK